MYTDFFKHEDIVLKTKEKGGKGAEKEERKTLFYCCDVPGFLLKVCLNREIRLEDQKIKFGLDHGLEWEKFVISLSPNLPIFQPGTSFSSPNTSFLPAEEKADNRGGRRSREDGVVRGCREDTGQRAVLFLGVIHKFKETAHNLRVVLEKLQLSKLAFSITADLCALHPLFGLMPCSATHSCLYCTCRRTKGKWEDEASGELRTLGGQAARYEYWAGPLQGLYMTEYTALSKSTEGPVLVRSL